MNADKTYGASADLSKKTLKANEYGNNKDLYTSNNYGMNN